MTMCYIIFVQPSVMAQAGMDRGAVLVATCVSSFIACVLMGLWANYPVALAPAMGHNFYFALFICGVLGYTWQEALAANLIAALLFIIIAASGLQTKIMDAIPNSLKHGIAVGIGLLITLVGLEWAGIVVYKPGTYIGLGELSSPPTLVSILGVSIIFVLISKGVRSALLLGLLFTGLIGIVVGIVKFHGLVSVPPSISPTFLKFNLRDLFSQSRFYEVIFIFLFLDIFDTIGTLVGVGFQAGLVENGRLLRSRPAFSADAIGTLSGTLMGTSTITSYIESAAGVAVGGRTGLTAIVAGAGFILALFFAPLVETIGGVYVTEYTFQVGKEGVKGVIFLYPVVAPVLIVIGSYMMKGVKEIDWRDPVMALPSFLAIIIMPFTFGIAEGIAFGFIALSILCLFTRRLREVHWLVHLLSLIFIFKYAFLG
jgi:AGZA family xanthine/uracil permease-like MFS transporter